jgi:ribosomal protein L7Ae-like RNA K-turn-binding protein
VNDDKFYSFLGIIQKSGKLVSGYNNCEFEIKKDKCTLVIIAEDASCNTKEKFTNMCNTRSLPYFIHGNKESLGFSIGKFPTSVIAIKHVGMSKVVLNMLR